MSATMASSESNDRNPNGFYLIYDKDESRNISELSKLIPGLVFINDLPRKEDKDKMLICALPKTFYDNNSAESLLEKYNIAIRRFRPPINDKLKEGTTYGFYVTSNVEYINFSSALNSLFSLFENSNLIEKDSYEIIYPKPYPNGCMRNYAIVSFRKNEKGIFPKSYIRKLKILVNNSLYQEVTFKVDWLSVNVMRDIKKGHSKEKKEKANTAMDVSS